MSNPYKKTQVACYVGYVVQAIINNFLPILFVIFSKTYSLSYEQLGRIVFINFSVQIVSDVLSPLIVKLIGFRGAVITCHGLAASGLVMLSVLPKLIPDIFTAICLSVIVYAFGSGIIEVILSPMIELLPTVNKAKGMAFLHSFYCWGQALTVVVTTLLISLLGSENWRFIPLIWAVIPFVNMLAFTRVPIVEPPKDEKGGGKAMFFNFEFVCFMIFMLCAGASEITMAEWASALAQEGLGIDKVTGDILGPCAFAIFMGLGRVIFGVFAGKFSPVKALLINNVLCFICYVVVAVCKMPFFSLLACAFCGFTVSLSWPGTYSLAAERFKNGGAVMFSVFALCGDLGCSVGPWIFGFAADRISFSGGFLICAVFPVVMIVTAVYMLVKTRTVQNNI